jgi:UDP-N-acetylmuramoyl-L-alanyl-D-glutamate--2,6-diaminopimelate ligase
MNIPFPTHYPVACHTDNVTLGTMFVAIRGQQDDGTRFIAQAIEKGATQIVVQAGTQLTPDVIALMHAKGISCEYVPDTRLALAQLSAQAAGNQVQRLRIIGITGTKGKTTTAFLLEHILQAAGKKTALLGTVKNRIKGHDLPAPLTTPQPDYLQQFLLLCVQHGVEYVVMEVAAQALSLHRVHGIAFDGIIFTNFSHEHLEFYATLDDYFAAKKTIFSHAKPNAPLLINADDSACQALIAAHQNATPFGMLNTAAVTGTSINTPEGLHITGSACASPFTVCNSRLMGGFNAYNILAALGMAFKLGIQVDQIEQALTTFAGVPGRLQCYSLKNGACCIIDYAHNPSSYQAVLSLLKSKTDHLIVIFGAGGGRDKSKRPIMGRIASQLADQVILTSDNPRDEEAQAIAQDILAGIHPDHYGKVLIQLDRERAIHKAYELSKKDSIIAILGKGADEYQLVKGVKTHFSEAGIIKQLE